MKNLTFYEVADDYIRDRETVMDEAENLYSEHREIASLLETSMDQRAERHRNPGKFRIMWAGAGSTTVSLRAITGGRLRRQINGLQGEMETNRIAAHAHVEENFPVYVAAAMALDVTLSESAESSMDLQVLDHAVGVHHPSVM